MADTQVLREYLVSLGFDLKKQQFSQFEKLLHEAEARVNHSGLSMVKTIGGVATAIVGAYTAIGAATVGLLDKVANSDLGYQLYAMKMYMSVDAAKHLKIATDALGHSIDEIAWNPELFSRYQQLIKLQQGLEKQLGPEFKDRMRGIRDFRFELTRLQVTLQYLAMGVASNVFARLEKDMPGLSAKVRNIVDYLANHLPEIADQIGSKLAPIIENIATNSKILAESLMKGLGLLFDDDEMRKGTLNFENLGRAIGHVVTFVTTLTEEVFALFESLVHMAKFAWYFQTMQFGKAAKEGMSMGGDLKRHFENIQHIAAQDIPTPTVPGGNAPTAAMHGNTADTARQLAKQVSMKTGIPADLIFAQWSHETGGFGSRVAVQQQNWAGIRGPMGIGYRSFSSPQDFADYYANLMMNKRYQGAGVSSARTPEEFASALKRGGYYEDTYAHYAAGLRRWQPGYGSGGGGTRIDVGGVQVHIMQPNATPEQIYTATSHAVNDALGKRTQKNIAEFGGPYN